MTDTAARSARERLDRHVREIVQWHFDPATGCPFWLERAKQFTFDPLTDVHSFADLGKFGFFEDEGLRGGPVRRWVPGAMRTTLRLRDGGNDRRPEDAHQHR